MMPADPHHQPPMRAVAHGPLFNGRITFVESDAIDGSGIMSRAILMTNGMTVTLWYSPELPDVAFDSYLKLRAARRSVSLSMRRRAVADYPRRRGMTPTAVSEPCACCNPADRHLRRRTWRLVIARNWRTERDISVVLCLNHLAEYRDNIPALCALIQCP